MPNANGHRAQVRFRANLLVLWLPRERAPHAEGQCAARSDLPLNCSRPLGSASRQVDFEVLRPITPDVFAVVRYAFGICPGHDIGFEYKTPHPAPAHASNSNR